MNKFNYLSGFMLGIIFACFVLSSFFVFLILSILFLLFKFSYFVISLAFFYDIFVALPLWQSDGSGAIFFTPILVFIAYLSSYLRSRFFMI